MLTKSLRFHSFSVTKRLVNLSFKELATKNRSIIVPTLKQYRYFSHKAPKDKLLIFDTTLRDGEQVILDSILDKKIIIMNYYN
jgi:hypothetical protein